MEKTLDPLLKVDISGQLPREGPAIAVFNHNPESVRYPMLGLAVLFSSYPFKKLAYMRYPGNFYSSFPRSILGFIESLGITGIPATIEGIKGAVKHLEDGKILLIAPEGTGSRDGTLGPGRNGAAWLARKTGTSILPIGIRYDHYGKDQDLLNPLKVSHVGVKVGKLFDPYDELGLLGELTEKERLSEATEIVMQRIFELISDDV